MNTLSRLSLLLTAFTLVIGGYATANAATDVPTGSVFKGKTIRTLYYLSEDGKRYVFPNEKTYKSWFSNFDDVVEIEDDELGDIALGGNVRYKPGSFLVKITTDPKVYAVSGNGRLRWVKTEAVAKKLYGDNWSLLVDDVPDAFFVNYSIDDPIEDDDEFDPLDEENETPTIDINRKKLKRVINKIKSHTRTCENLETQFNKLQERLANLGIEIDGLGDDFIERCVDNEPTDEPEDDDDTVKDGKVRICHIVTRRNDKMQTLIINKSAVRAHLRHGDTLGACEDDDDRDDDDNDDDTDPDTTAPVISNKAATVSGTSAATITWTTDEEATSAVVYATSSTATATELFEKEDDALMTSHSVELSGLDESTTYYYYVLSEDAADNTATSDEQSFTTGS